MVCKRPSSPSDEVPALAGGLTWRQSARRVFAAAARKTSSQTWDDCERSQRFNHRRNQVRTASPKAPHGASGRRRRNASYSADLQEILCSDRVPQLALGLTEQSGAHRPGLEGDSHRPGSPLHKSRPAPRALARGTAAFRTVVTESDPGSDSVARAWADQTASIFSQAGGPVSA